MKVIFISIITLFILSNKGLEDVRNSFQKASISEDDAVHFNKLVQQDLSIEENLLSAYLGASETLLAKYGDSPAEKLKLFKAGKAKIENAITNDSKSVEVRLIRLIIQNNAPSFLRYSNEIESDKTFIFENYHSASVDVKKFVQKIAQNTDLFTDQEQTKFK